MPVKNPADPATWTVDINGKVWTPTRSGSPLSRAFYQLEQELQRQRRRGPKVVDKTSGAAVITTAGLPKQVISCSATESPSAQVDRVFSQVSVTFTRDPGDQNFAGVHIWLTGYKGNNNPVLMTDASDSPAVFLCETTLENVTVTVQPFNGGHVAAPFAGAKTCVVALDGQTSAPAAPSIATTTTAITSGAVTVGQQFAFNYLPSSLTDVIDGYWIYRTNVHSTPGISARWKFVKASVQNAGLYTCVDSSGVSTNFYYVSSVNKQGLESSLTDAAPAGGGGTTATYRPTTSTAIFNGGYSTPANVWDGNSTTSASAIAANVTKTIESSWQGFASAVGVNTTTLKITSSVTSANILSTYVLLEYSLDGGSTWTQIYQSYGNRATKTDAISVPVATNISKIKVRATMQNAAGSPYTVKSYVYEIWVETT